MTVELRASGFAGVLSGTPFNSPSERGRKCRAARRGELVVCDA